MKPGMVFPTHYGGETGFRELFPPHYPRPWGGNIFISPPLSGEILVFPPHFGVFSPIFRGFGGISPHYLGPWGEVKNRFPPIMGGGKDDP